MTSKKEWVIANKVEWKKVKLKCQYKKVDIHQSTMLEDVSVLRLSVVQLVASTKPGRGIIYQPLCLPGIFFFLRKRKRKKNLQSLLINAAGTEIVLLGIWGQRKRVLNSLDKNLHAHGQT